MSPLGEWPLLRKRDLGTRLNSLRDSARRLRERLRILVRGPDQVPAAAGGAANDLVSVILTTYDRPAALDAALRALAHQTDRDFEIVVADDGSGPETAEVIKNWKERIGVPLKHAWHQHQGFRGSEIRNRAIRISAGKYCIFLDGDCLARDDFVATHRKLAEAGWFVAGNRILLSPKLTAKVLAEGVTAEAWDLATLSRERLAGGVNRLLPALRLPLGPLRKLHHNDWEGAKTCNLAVARGDLDRVDGFDGRYTGWGLEDSDLVVRLLRAGIHRKDGRFATGVLHLWHQPADLSCLPQNERQFDEALNSGHVQAKRGLSALADQAKATASAR